MLFNSSDDDLPDIPTVTEDPSQRRPWANTSASTTASTRDDQMRRLQNLEEQFRVLREEMRSQNEAVATAPEGGGGGAVISKRRSLRGASSSTERTEKSVVADGVPDTVPGPARATVATPPPPPSPPSDPEASIGVAAASEDDEPASAGDAGDQALREEEVHYELRRLVPHLSPGFSCDYRDAVLLIGAIRNGGSGQARGQESLMDRITTTEAERRNLDSRLAKKTDECDALRLELEHSRQKMRAIQQQAQQSTTLLSQKREEMRKQLLREESRAEKVQMKNKVLERENEDLKNRLRLHMR